MSPQEIVKEKAERIRATLMLKPQLGKHTYVSTTKIDNQLSCEITEGVWKLQADMPKSAGGKGEAPTPGVLGRAALGSCLAMGYMLNAAHRELPIRSLEVQIHADDDDGGLFGTSDDPPGYSEVRYLVLIDTDLSMEEITEFLDGCDTHSPWRDIISRAIPCVREINLLTR